MAIEVSPIIMPIGLVSFLGGGVVLCTMLSVSSVLLSLLFTHEAYTLAAKKINAILFMLKGVNPVVQCYVFLLEPNL